MNSRSLSTSEKALIEREFVHRQECADRKRRNVTRIFVLSLAAAFVSALTFRSSGLYWLSLGSRMVWLIGSISFFICLGSSAHLSRSVDIDYMKNPWKGFLRELKEPRHVVQAAFLLGAFPAFRLIFLFVNKILK